MKKIITLLVTLILSMGCIFGLTACGKKSGQIKFIDVKLTDEEYAIAVNKGKPQLKADINAALKEIDIEAIITKYNNLDSVTEGYTFKSTSTNPENELIVATNAEFPPFEYKKGTQYFGIDIEILNKLAEKLNKEVVLLNLNFDAIITSVQGVEIPSDVDTEGYDTYSYSDIAIAGLSVTEERKQSVDFTDSYFKSSQVLVVKSDDTTFDAVTALTVEDLTYANAKDILPDEVTEAEFNAEIANLTADEKAEALIELKTMKINKILSEMQGKKAGSQNGTTGEYFIKGSGDWLEGYANIGYNGYTSYTLAIEDMLNGNINFVVSDYETAKALVEKF
ncbi:MAG: transporter substrate-binding domain-containing protein [Clostridia bacterium]|nr:transporter substrate-binding domain-containing protein [Clostridia bacterium]